MQDGIFEFTPEVDAGYARFRNHRDLKKLFNFTQDKAHENHSTDKVVTLTWTPLDVPIKTFHLERSCAAPTTLPPSGYAIQDWMLGKDKYDWLADLIWKHSFDANAKGCGSAVINCAGYMLSWFTTKGRIKGSIGPNFPSIDIDTRESLEACFLFNVSPTDAILGFVRDPRGGIVLQHRNFAASSAVSKTMQICALYEMQVTELLVYIQASVEELRGAWNNATKVMMTAFEKLFTLLKDYGYKYASGIGNDPPKRYKLWVVCHYLSTVLCAGESQNLGEGAWTQWLDSSMGENGLQRLHRILNDCCSSIETVFVRCITRAVKHLEAKAQQYCSICVTYPLESGDIDSPMYESLNQKMTYFPHFLKQLKSFTEQLELQRKSMLELVTVYKLFAKFLIWTTKVKHADSSDKEAMKKVNEYQLKRNEITAVMKNVTESSKHLFSNMVSEWKSSEKEQEESTESSNIFGISFPEQIEENGGKTRKSENTKKREDICMEPLQWNQRNSTNAFFYTGTLDTGTTAQHLLFEVCNAWKNIVSQTLTSPDKVASEVLLARTAEAKPVGDVMRKCDSNLVLLGYCEENSPSLLSLQFLEGGKHVRACRLALPCNVETLSIKALGESGKESSKSQFAVLFWQKPESTDELEEDERVLSLCIISLNEADMGDVSVSEKYLNMNSLPVVGLTDHIERSRAAGVIKRDETVELSVCGARSTAAILVGSRRCIIYDLEEDDDSSESGGSED